MSAKEGRGVVCAGVVESICLGVSSATSREKEREQGGHSVGVLPTDSFFGVINSSVFL